MVLLRESIKIYGEKAYLSIREKLVSPQSKRLGPKIGGPNRHMSSDDVSKIERN